MKYYLLQLGCQMNISDGERVKSVLRSIGYAEAEDEREADLLGIIACSVRQKAIDKVYHRIHTWNRTKRDRSVLTFLSGCVLPSDREKLADRFDLIFTINELPRLPQLIATCGVVTPAALQASNYDRSSAADRESPAVTERTPARTTADGRARMFTPAFAGPHGVTEDIRDGFWRVEPTRTSDFDAYVPIQNGCDKFCTFCAVPYTRGREVSRSSDDILAEVEDLVARGYRSITLLGQNVNSYGLDKRSAEMRFAQLLDAVGQVTAGHDVWVYFTSPHPRDMTREVIETVAAHDTIANQIHLPIQSGDDKVLIRMNRNYRVVDYRRVVGVIRELLPQATLFTDVIVGFSGETDAQFQRTRAAMEEFAYNMAYIAIYSPRPGAASSRWRDDVPEREKKQRLVELTAVLKRSAKAANEALVGREVTVLIEGRDRKPEYLRARTEGRIPVRVSAGAGLHVGRFARVRIASAQALSLGAVPVRVGAAV